MRSWTCCWTDVEVFQIPRLVELHGLAYDRYEHGNPVLFGMTGRAPPRGSKHP